MNLEWEIARALSTSAASGGLADKPRPPRPGVQGRELTYDDVRDERIEVAAQHSLVRLSKKTPAERQAANEMLAAIKGGQLAAIYQENMTAPAKRARAVGGNWWDITRGADAIMQDDPYGIERPILVFRAAAANDPDKMDRALAATWSSAQPSCPGAGTPGAAPEAIPPGCTSSGPGFIDAIDEAIRTSRWALRVADRLLAALQVSVAAKGLGHADVRTRFRRTLCAMQWCLRVAPTRPVQPACPGDTVPATADDARFMQSVAKARDHIRNNLNTCIAVQRPGQLQVIPAPGPAAVTISFSQAGCVSVNLPTGHAATLIATPVTYLCSLFFQKCRQCQRDVITHELFHVLFFFYPKISSTDDGKDRLGLTPQEALSSAEMMAQLTSYIVSGCTDFCAKPGTACKTCPNTNNCDRP
jgi:hypothetical protein